MTQSPAPYDAVVIGAGPAGSATAARLAERGFRVALLDRARFPRTKPCAEYVSPGTVAALGRLGVLPEVLAERPARLRGMRVVGADGRGFEGRFAEGEGLGIARARLDQILVRAAMRRGAVLLEGTTFVHCAPSTGGVVRVLARDAGGPVELAARLVVGADGLTSRVARQLGIARPAAGRTVALVAHAAGVTGMRDVGEMHVGRAGYVGLAPLGAGVTNVAVVVGRDHARPRGGPADQLRALLAQFPTVRERVARAQLVSPVRGVGPFGRGTRRATADQALLVGDAADFYDPFTGEGVFAALTGAELAAEAAASALARDRLSAADLAPYDVVDAGAPRRVGGRAPARPGARHAPPGARAGPRRPARQRHGPRGAPDGRSAAVLPLAAGALTIMPPVDSTQFRHLLGRFATGVTVVTALDPGGRPAGMTASALSALSLEPPLLLVCVGHQAEFLKTIRQAEHFALNVLAADQEHLSRLFAATGVDHFASVPYRRGPSGVPLLDGVVAHIVCDRAGQHDAGDHTVFFGLVTGGEAFDRAPLLYFRSAYTTTTDGP
jgi:menaquinone-9 beta-reductase